MQGHHPPTLKPRTLLLYRTLQAGSPGPAPSARFFLPLLELKTPLGVVALCPARLPYEASTLTVQAVSRSPESDAIADPVTDRRT